MDLSSLFAPVQAAQTPTAQAQAPVAPVQPDAAPDLKSRWDSFFANPAAQGALLSFGLNALAGGWGTPTQNLATSLGQGIESGADIAQTAQQTADTEADRAAKRQNQAFEQDYKNRELSTRERIADKTLAARSSIAQMKMAPTSKEEQRAYDAYVRSTATSLRQNQLFSSMTDDEIEGMAEGMGQRFLEARRRQFPNGGGSPTFAPQGQTGAGTGGSAPAGSRPSTGNVGASQTRGNSAPEGTVVKMPDGTMKKKVNGVWVNQ